MIPRGHLGVLASSAACLLLLPDCASVGRRTITLPPPPPSIVGFSALYQVIFADGRSRRRARLAVAYSRPDRLRLEVLDPLGSSRVVLVSARDRALLLDLSERTFRSYESGRDALEDLAGLALDPDLLAWVLLGDPAAAAGIRCESQRRRCAGPGGDPILQVRESGEEIRVQFSSGAGVELQGVRPGGGTVGAPRSIRLREMGGSRLLELELRELDYHLPGDDLFSPVPPRGFRVGASGEDEGPLLGRMP